MGTFLKAFSEIRRKGRTQRREEGAGMARHGVQGEETASVVVAAQTCQRVRWLE